MERESISLHLVWRDSSGSREACCMGQRMTTQTADPVTATLEPVEAHVSIRGKPAHH